MEVAAAEPETLKPEDAQQLLGDQLTEEMPAAQPVAAAANAAETAEKPVPAPAAPSPAAAGSTAAATDAQGNVFNPLLHETNEDGSPVYRKDGRTLKRRRTPLSEWSETSSMGTLPEDPPGAPAGAAPEPAPADGEKERLMIAASAATLTGAQLMLMRLALGDACGTETAEREGLVDAWTAVLQHYGIGSVHPLVGLAMVTGMVGFRAVHEPKNESKVQKLRHWLQRKALGAWQWFTGRRAPPAAPAAGEAPSGA